MLSSICGLAHMAFSLVLYHFHKEQRNNAVPHNFKNQWKMKSEELKINKNEYIKGTFNYMETFQRIEVDVDK